MFDFPLRGMKVQYSPFEPFEFLGYIIRYTIQFLHTVDTKWFDVVNTVQLIICKEYFEISMANESFHVKDQIVTELLLCMNDMNSIEMFW